jgi:hypothetical protein
LLATLDKSVVNVLKALRRQGFRPSEHLPSPFCFLFLVRCRAIYFAAYSTAKEKLNGVMEPDSTPVHMVSAGLAGNLSS